MGHVRCQSFQHCGLLFKPESDATCSSHLSQNPPAYSSPWLSSPAPRGCWHPLPTQHQPEHSWALPSLCVGTMRLPTPCCYIQPSKDIPAGPPGRGSMAHSKAAGLRWVTAATEEFGRAADSCREHFWEHHLHWDLTRVHLSSGPHNTDHLSVDAN